ncbi:MAG: hypothetical protein K6U74_04950 [Firmicutes bacterium]|nr:hypothetical protein [Bacillota bacterium]
MFNFGKNKKTKLEIIEELKGKRLAQKDSLVSELQRIDNDIRAAILNEKNTNDLMKTKITIQEKILNIDNEIMILDEEQSKVQLDHYKTKMKEMQEEINKKLEEIEPHRIKYEEAKKQFKKVETEWFEIHRITLMQIDELHTKMVKLRAKIDGIEYNNTESAISQ